MILHSLHIVWVSFFTPRGWWRKFLRVLQLVRLVRCFRRGVWEGHPLCTAAAARVPRLPHVSACWTSWGTRAQLCFWIWGNKRERRGCMFMENAWSCSMRLFLKTPGTSCGWATSLVSNLPSLIFSLHMLGFWWYCIFFANMSWWLRYMFYHVLRCFEGDFSKNHWGKILDADAILQNYGVDEVASSPDSSPRWS